MISFKQTNGWIIRSRKEIIIQAYVYYSMEWSSKVAEGEERSEGRPRLMSINLEHQQGKETVVWKPKDEKQRTRKHKN